MKKTYKRLLTAALSTMMLTSAIGGTVQAGAESMSFPTVNMLVYKIDEDTQKPLSGATIKAKINPFEGVPEGFIVDASKSESTFTIKEGKEYAVKFNIKAPGDSGNLETEKYFNIGERSAYIEMRVIEIDPGLGVLPDNFLDNTVAKASILVTPDTNSTLADSNYADFVKYFETKYGMSTSNPYFFDAWPRQDTFTFEEVTPPPAPEGHEWIFDKNNPPKSTWAWVARDIAGEKFTYNRDSTNTMGAVTVNKDPSMAYDRSGNKCDALPQGSEYSTALNIDIPVTTPPDKLTPEQLGDLYVEPGSENIASCATADVAMIIANQKRLLVPSTTAAPSSETTAPSTVPSSETTVPTTEPSTTAPSSLIPSPKPKPSTTPSATTTPKVTETPTTTTPRTTTPAPKPQDKTVVDKIVEKITEFIPGNKETETKIVTQPGTTTNTVIQGHGAIMLPGTTQLVSTGPVVSTGGHVK